MPAGRGARRRGSGLCQVNVFVSSNLSRPLERGRRLCIDGPFGIRATSPPREIYRTKSVPVTVSDKYPNNFRFRN